MGYLLIKKVAAMRSAAVELLEQWPKGCPAPIGYADWFEWARAQKLHGLTPRTMKLRTRPAG